MKRVLFPFLASLLAALAFGQQVVQVATLPTSRDLWGVSFIGPNTGWVAGDGHTLFKTTDRGVSWSPVFVPGFQSTPFYSVYFVSSSLGFLSGNSALEQQDLYRTTDGGTTWTPIADFPMGGSYYHIDFVNSTTGFMGANGSLVKSVDAGLTWNIRSAYPDCPIMYGLDFWDANTGLAAGYQISTNQGGIFKTTDGGQTWTLERAGNVNKAVYLSSLVAIAVDGTEVVRSTDAGDHWATVGFLTNGAMDLANPTGNIVVAVDTGGSVFRSADGGFSWTQRYLGVGDLPGVWRIRFSDASNGFVTGTGGTILETSDGGLTWTNLNRGHGTEWQSIVAFNDNDVLAVGLHGYAMTSNDQGSHWQTKLLDPPTFGRDTLFSDVAKLGPTSAYVVGHWGSMFKTTDMGQTWMDLSFSVNPNYYANGVAFTDALNGWVAGFDYQTGPKTYIRQTHDGGLTWQGASLNVPSLDVAMVGQTGYVLTTSQPLYKTTDGGATWTALLISTPTGDATSNMAMSFASPNVGYVAGFDGFLAKTTDGGATWNRVRPPASSFVYLDVLALSATEVWATGASQGGGNAVLLKSTDGGATWQSWPLDGEYIVATKLSASANFVYASGSQGRVWKVARSAFAEVPPASFSVFRGRLAGGSLASLLNSDDSYLVVLNGLIGNRAEPPVSVILDATSPTANPSAMQFTLEAHTSIAALAQTIELWDFVASNWVLVSTTPSTLADSVQLATATSPARFVQQGTNAVRAKVSWKAVGPVPSSVWSVSIDKAGWKIAP